MLHTITDCIETPLITGSKSHHMWYEERTRIWLVDTNHHSHVKMLAKESI